MNIAFLSSLNPRDIHNWSGTLYYMYHHLEKDHRLTWTGWQQYEEAIKFHRENFGEDPPFSPEKYAQLFGKMLTDLFHYEYYDLIICRDYFFLAYLTTDIPVVYIGDTTAETKEMLAAKVFIHTAHYDALIAGYFSERLNIKYPKKLTLTYEKKQDLRYGENPHQSAAFYASVLGTQGTLTGAVQLHGKELSYNNIGDTDGALETLKEFDEPTIVAAKHANPCGVGSAETLVEAYRRAYEADPVSIFGGIVAANREIDAATATEMAKIFLEVIVAPSFSKEALEILTKKKNLRLLQLDHIDQKNRKASKAKTVLGGLLIQDSDTQLLHESELKVVTKRQPTEAEMRDLLFAWKVVKHTKSNGIAIAKDLCTTGVGPGQVSRIWALENAIRQGSDRIAGSVMASDAFFPFSDCVEAAHQAGITAIIQPGGSVRDQESIDAANKYGIAMIFTGMRHFKH